ncbi:microfibril-associated glycoprotein 4-like [Mercenaria mercenaria]|uniref:microfibril-associated glycoprotein 4-like n=1 Tax=Mercenaria mercenaria TaxID=6596 RepID=UPI00234EEE58|nr:microfibril-associated glycoprotein 4-like [Mercenaria mercenaria]
MFFRLCLVWLLTEFSNSENWTPGIINVHTDVTQISGHTNQTLIYKTVPGISMPECVSECFSGASFYFIKHNYTCHCNSFIDDDGSTSKTGSGIMYGYVLEGFKTFTFQNFKKLHVLPEEKDCLALFEKGYIQDGVYIIQPAGGTSVEAWCDMTNGGWTVVQRRQDGTENFYRTWQDYVEGFGNRTGEYWLGLENIYALTRVQSSLRFEMETFGDILPTSAYAVYNTFWIDDESSNFQLHTSGFSGDCGDSFTVQNGYLFTTIDRDNDVYNDKNCAVEFGGAWWHKACHQSNLNGRYYAGNHSSFGDGINWDTCWGYNYSVKKAMMKVKRN